MRASRAGKNILKNVKILSQKNNKKFRQYGLLKYTKI